MDGKLVTGTGFSAWIFIGCVLLSGCYSSTLIEPRGKATEELTSGEIKWITLKDGRRYEFSPPPRVVGDSIFGETHRFVSIPISDVAHNYIVEEPGKGSSERTQVIVTRDSLSHRFDVATEFSEEKAFVGNETITLRVPLSDVADASVREIDVVWSIAGMVVLVGSIIGITALLVNLPHSGW
jgi:hypothetical protein